MPPTSPMMKQIVVTALGEHDSNTWDWEHFKETARGSMGPEMSAVGKTSLPRLRFLAQIIRS